MTDAAPAALAQRVSALERRLRSTERASRLERASVMVDETAGTALDVSQTLVDSTTAPANLARAILAMVMPDEVADGVLVVWFTPGQPAGALGDLWLDPYRLLWKHDGAVWVPLVDQAYAQAVFLANDALSTADGFITAFWQTAAPAVGSIGDLWFKIDANNSPYRWNGNEWRPLITQNAQSANYQQGTSGWGVTDDGDAQFQDLQALGTVGADQVSARAIALAGEDLGDWITRSPRGIIARAVRGLSGLTSAGDTVGTTELLLFDFSAATVEAGRLYRITLHGFLQGSVEGDTFDLQTRYTIDNSAPAVPGSPIMDGSTQRFQVQRSFVMSYDYEPTSTGPLRMALTLRRITGTGVGRIFLDGGNRRMEWTIEDLGLTVNSNTSIAQIAKSNGDPPDPTPVSTITKTYPCTWSKNMRSNGSGHVLAPLPPPSFNKARIGQGYNPDGVSTVVPGNTSDRGLVGFASATIMADMAGGVPLNAYLTFTLVNRRTADGCDVRVAKHNYASAPSFPAGSGQVFPNANVVEDISAVPNAAPGATYKVELGPVVAAELQSGATKGFGFSAPDDGTNHDGYMYGYDEPQRPILTVVYQA